MTYAGIRELKDPLSEYIRRAREGERVVITDRGRPVAALVALPEEAGSEVAWNMVRQGARGLERRQADGSYFRVSGPGCPSRSRTRLPGIMPHAPGDLLR